MLLHTLTLMQKLSDARPLADCTTGPPKLELVLGGYPGGPGPPFKLRYPQLNIRHPFFNLTLTLASVDSASGFFCLGILNFNIATELASACPGRDGARGGHISLQVLVVLFLFLLLRCALPEAPRGFGSPGQT